MCDPWPDIVSLLNESRRQRLALYRRQADESASCGVVHGSHGHVGRAQLAEAIDRPNSQCSQDDDPFELLREFSSQDRGISLMDYFQRTQCHSESLERQTEDATTYRFRFHLEELKGSGLLISGPLTHELRRMRSLSDDAAKCKPLTSEHDEGLTASSTNFTSDKQILQPKISGYDERDIEYITSRYNCQGDEIFTPIRFSEFSIEDSEVESTLLPALRLLLPLATSLIKSRAVWRWHCSFLLPSENNGQLDPRNQWHSISPGTGYGVHPFIMRWPRNRAEMLHTIQTTLPMYQTQPEDEDAENAMFRVIVPDSPIMNDIAQKSDIEANRCGFVTLKQVREMAQQRDAVQRSQLSKQLLSSISSAIDASSSSPSVSSASTDAASVSTNPFASTAAFDFPSPPASASDCSCCTDYDIECPVSHNSACDPDCGQCHDPVDPYPKGPTFCLDHLQLMRGCMWWRCARSIHMIRQIILRKVCLTESFVEGKLDGLDYAGDLDWGRVFAAATLPIPAVTSSNDTATPAAASSSVHRSSSSASPLTVPLQSASSAAASSCLPPTIIEPQPHLSPLPAELAATLRESLPWALDVVFGARSAIRPVPVMIVAPLAEGWIGGFMGAGDFQSQ